MKADTGKTEISVPDNITLPADKIVLFKIRGISEMLSGTKKISIPYKVKNLLIAPDEGLHAEININVAFIPVSPEIKQDVKQ